MKLILSFGRGQYSPIKNDFKSIFSEKFKWDGKKGWYGKDGFVEATEKMETGAPVIFMIECDTLLGTKFSLFATKHNIIHLEVQDFSEFNPDPEQQILPSAQEQPVSRPTMSHNIPPWEFGEFWKYQKNALLSGWNLNFKVVWKRYK